MSKVTFIIPHEDTSV